MKILTLNGSPKYNDSSSEYFLNKVESNFQDVETINYKLISVKKYDEILNDIEGVQAIVLSLPLYVDSIPAHVISFLSYVEKNKKEEFSKIKVYVISNAGFFEGEQNQVSIRIFKCWCKRAGFKWGQGLGIGAGIMLKKMKSFNAPNRDLFAAMEKLAGNILQLASGEDMYVCPKYIPKTMFIAMGNKTFYEEAKKNGVSKKEIGARKGQ